MSENEINRLLVLPDMMKNILIWVSLFILIGVNLSSCTNEVHPVVQDPDPEEDPIIPLDEEPLAFIGAEGFGKDATGGRGGTVLFVTNLNDSGTGSFRAAVDASGPRIVVFKVSGNIELKKSITIRNGDLTIAGQSAPGDGICLQNYGVTIAASNIIIRFMRFRLGDLYKQQVDAISGRYERDIILDHCSISWSLDEAASFYANQNFTFQWSIIAESLNDSYHDKGIHGYGAIWGGDSASFHHNLLAHHNSRNPRFNGYRSGVSNGIYPNEHVDYRNNVIYNWLGNSAYGGENGNYNIVNNYYKPGPATPSSKGSRIMEISKESDLTYGPGYGSFYIEGNYVAGNSAITENNWDGGIKYATGVTQSMAQLLEPLEADFTSSHSAEQAFEAVLSYAGASHSRDIIDLRIIDEVRNGTATFSGSKTNKPGIIDSQTDVGGWPELKSEDSKIDTDSDGMPDEWETAMKLDPNTANASGRDLSTAYDNIEVYLHSLVANIIEEQIKE